MKRIKKSLLVAGVLATAGISSLGAVSMASAATSSTGQDSLIDKIASKFKLNKDEVKAVFDEDRTTREAEREQKMKDKLAQAVKDGKLTQAQADKITAKMAEMKTFMESLKDKTETERKSAMDTKRDEIKKWIEDNNIPEGYMPMGPGGPGGHGMMGGPRGDKAE